MGAYDCGRCGRYVELEQQAAQRVNGKIVHRIPCPRVENAEHSTTNERSE